VVDSTTWKKVTLYAEETWYDGTIDTINVVTLVPPEWIALHDAKVGSFVPISLDLQEMGLDENLLAKVQAIERCTEIRAGPGRVVLTTVNHLSRGICNLTYINSTGQGETIRPTITHRFYSLDRNDWVHIGDARFGEKLQGLGNDAITVISCQPLDKTERVYNMTVEDEHVYHVGYLNLLAHNEGCLPLPKDGIHMNTNEALDAVEKFLGPSYFSFRDGRFVSKDGLRQVRFGKSDLSTAHAPMPHMNFQEVKPGGKPNDFSKNNANNSHVFLPEEQ
jgi:hypothetical protein